jgi:hypothetical protein
MKAVHVIVLGVLTLSLTAAAVADQLPPNDPQIKTGGPLAASSFPASAIPAASLPAGIFTPDFVIQSPSGTSPGTSPCILVQGPHMVTSPQCYFENDIRYATNGFGNTIYQLIFDAFGISPDTVTCGFLTDSPFTACGVDPISGGTQITFSGGSIGFHDNFTLSFAGFPPDFSFPTTASTITTPEPSSLALLLAGVGSLALRRRRE